MDALVRSGKIRYWGVSNHSASQVSTLHNICQTNPDKSPIVGTEDYYNITIGERFDPELFRVLREAKKGLLAFSPQEAGILSSGREKEAGKTRMPVLRALDQVARELGATPPAGLYRLVPGQSSRDIRPGWRRESGAGGGKFRGHSDSVDKRSP